jgi:uncharacterized protein (DUF2147 family)
LAFLSSRFLTCLAAFLVSGFALAADLSPVGVWKTIDDKTGKPKGLVRIFERSGEYFGKIEVSLSDHKKERCDVCKDERKDQPLIGMEVLRHMKRSGNEFVSGDILDPDNGSVYRCKMKLDAQGKKLQVRGFIGFSLLGRTQTWIREQ